MSKNIIPQNSQYPRCVDGRQAVAFIEWVDAGWVVSKKGEKATQESGPQFLGASLLFVKALEELAGKDRVDAFRIVEQASQKIGWGLEIHIDDHQGKYDYTSMSDEEIIEMISRHHTGCGFARYAWGDQITDVISLAKDHHWRVQVLQGSHEEMGAIINMRTGYTFMTAKGVEADQEKFNTDLGDAEKMFGVLGEIIKDETFADRAMEWTSKIYKEIVVSLKGVENVAQVEINE